MSEEPAIRRPKGKRISQFGLRGLLAFVALIAVLMVPMSYFYRARLNRPNLFASATLMIGAQGDDSAKYLAQLDTVSFRQLLVDAPQLQNLSPLRDSPDRSARLTNHLSIRTVGNTDLIEIMAHGRSERLKSRDLKAIVDTTIEIIRTECRKANTPVTIVNTTSIEPSG